MTAASSYEGAGHPVHVRPNFFGVGGGVEGEPGPDSITADHLDEFDRTTAYGLGAGYTWLGVWDSFWPAASDSELLVDGSRLVIPDGMFYDSYAFDDVLPSAGEFLAEVFLPVLPSGEYAGFDDWWPTIRFYIATGELDGFGDPKTHMLNIEQDYETSFAGPGVRVGSRWDDAGVGGTIVVEPGNWYLFKMRYTAADNDCLYKGWKKGTDEPAAWLAVDAVTDDTTLPDSPSIIDVRNTGVGAAAYLDNIAWDPVAVVYDSGAGGGASATTIGPAYDEPRYKGQGLKVFATAKSPAGVDATQLINAPVPQPYPVYRGVSRAIHVFGPDDDSIPPVPPDPCVPDGYPTVASFDTFERGPFSAGWDTSDFGLAYSYVDITNPPPGMGGNHASLADFGEGSVGKLSWESGSPIVYFGPNGGSGDAGPWSDPSWTFKMRFKTGDWQYGGPDMVDPHTGFATIALKTNAREVLLQTGVDILHSPAHGRIFLDSVQTDFDWHPNQWYSVTWFYDSATGDSRVKVWETFFEAEPGAWTLEESLGPGDSPVEWMRVQGTSKDSSWDEDAPYVAYFDDFDFGGSAIPACDNVSTDLTTCWNEALGALLDDFARPLVPAGVQAAIIGCTSRGHYTWLDEGFDFYGDGSQIIALDGGLRAQLNGPEYDPVSGEGVTRGAYTASVYLPFEGRQCRISFNAQVEMGDYEPLGGGRTNRSEIYMTIERHSGSSFVPGTISMVQRYTFGIFIERQYGESAKVWLDRSWALPEYVEIGAGASTLLGVVVEIDDGTFRFTAGSHAESVAIPLEASEGDGFTKIQVSSFFHNTFNGDVDDIGFTPNSDFMSRISNLRVSSSLGNCVDVPPNSFAYPDFNGACSSDVRLIPPHSSTIYDGVTFRPQIGDPTTTLDRTICMLESAAMVLDWHTRGGLRVWGGELVPWCGRAADTIRAIGTNLENCQLAWQHYGQYLDIRKGQPWSKLVAALGEGRAVVLAGLYGSLSSGARCSATFTEAHGIALFPYFIGSKVLVGDPLCRDFKYVELSDVQAFAEALGVEFYGSHSPQPVYFAVSRAWA